MIRTVLLPTDLSDESDLVVEFALGLGSLGVRRLVLAHVVDAAGVEAPVTASKIDIALEKMRAVAGRVERSGMLVELRVPAGDPVKELLGLSSERHIDAVVCGTHGKKNLERRGAGSVAERLFKRTRVPTLLVRFGLLHEAEDPSELARAFGQAVVLPTDFSASARRAFDLTMSLPSGVIDRLHMIHVIDPTLRGDRLVKHEHGAEFQLGNLTAIAKEAGLEPTGMTRSGEAGRVILREAKQREATGIIMGTRGQSPLEKTPLGSASTEVVRQAPCPVLVVH